eukprot:TRINITY_DN10539_c1_g1_i2.p1 TRINITY_DN10539_c1_g1~~TRINITY_DN10539_c1_g1_i2.p1  ORF type:complete len:376 (+),score=60.56 TRINITY_DN10539_c1_g1_i2:36-1163(+)
MLFVMGCVFLCILAISMLMSYRRVLRGKRAFEWQGFHEEGEKLMEIAEGKLTWEFGDPVYVIDGEWVGKTGTILSFDVISGMVSVKLQSETIDLPRSQIRLNLMVTSAERLSLKPLKVRKGFLKFLTRVTTSMHPTFASVFTSIPGQPLFINASSTISLLGMPLLIIGSIITYTDRSSVDDSVWTICSFLIVIASTSLLNTFVIQPIIEIGQQFPLTSSTDDKRSPPTVDHFPIGTPVVLQRSVDGNEDDRVQLTLMSRRSIGRVLHHDSEDGSVTVRFAIHVVTCSPDDLLIISNCDSVAQMDVELEDIPPATSVTTPGRRKSCVALPQSKRTSIFGRMMTRYRRNTVRNIEAAEPNVLQSEPWVPTSYDLSLV